MLTIDKLRSTVANRRDFNGNLIESFKLEVTNGRANELWLDLLRLVYDEKTLLQISNTQLKECRRFFYAGLAAGVLEDKNLLDECSLFIQLIEKGVA